VPLFERRLKNGADCQEGGNQGVNEAMILSRLPSVS